MNRIISAIGGHRVVGGAVYLERRQRRKLVVRPQPIRLEVIALVGRGALHVERREVPRRDILANTLEYVDRVFLGPQRYAGRHVRPKLDHLPPIAASGLLSQQHARQVVLVHAVVDHYDRPAPLEPVIDRAREPLPNPLARRFRPGIGHRAERIVDHEDMGAAAHDCGFYANRVIRTALRRVPPPLGLAVRR